MEIYKHCGRFVKECKKLNNIRCINLYTSIYKILIVIDTKIVIDMRQELDVHAEDLPQLKDSYYECLLRSDFEKTVTDLDDAALLRMLTIKPE